MKVAKDLRDVFVCNRPDGFKFNYQLIVDEQIRGEIAQNGPVLVKHG